MFDIDCKYGSIISAKGSSFFVSCIYEDIYLPPVYIREEEEEEEEEECFFCG